MEKENTPQDSKINPAGLVLVFCCITILPMVFLVINAATSDNDFEYTVLGRLIKESKS